MTRSIITDAVRQPAVAGMFYPNHPDELARTVKQLMAEADYISTDGEVMALIVPHAGYMYSGLTAAQGFNLLQKDMYTSVVIVSPSHREYFDGISVYNGMGYRTPLGELAIDTELRDALLRNQDLVEVSIRGHGEEHAVEVQLPFLQLALGAVKILPIVMGDQRREYCTILADRLAALLKAHPALLIASTDLSHYYTSDVAEQLDSIMIDDIARFDTDGLMADLESKRVEACGGGPTVVVLRAASALGASKVHVLSHCNSGDVTGDRRRVVGYLSAAVVRPS